MVGVSSVTASEVVSNVSDDGKLLEDAPLSSQNPSGRNVPFFPNNLLPAKTAMSIHGSKAKTQKKMQNNTSLVVSRCLAFFRNSTSTKKNAMFTE